MATTLILKPLLVGGGEPPPGGAQTATLDNLAHGLYLGAITSLVVPELGEGWSRRQQGQRIALAMVLSALGTLPWTAVVYESQAPALVVRRALLGFALPLAVGFVFLARAREQDGYIAPSAPEGLPLLD